MEFYPQNISENPKFAADVMLGRLAKWLRILGYDVYYDPKISFFELIKIVITENRILLTRNTKFLTKPYIKKTFIHGDHLKDQLDQIVKEYSLNADNLFLRCVYCNEILEKIEKSKVKNEVPVYVYETNDNFRECGVCKRLYWKGTHVKHVKKLLSFDQAA